MLSSGVVSCGLNRFGYSKVNVCVDRKMAAIIEVFIKKANGCFGRFRWLGQMIGYALA